MLQPSSPLEELVQRVRGEYREMQSLRLTSSQAQRLFGLEPLTCAALLGPLLKEKLALCVAKTSTRCGPRDPNRTGDQGATRQIDFGDLEHAFEQNDPMLIACRVQKFRISFHPSSSGGESGLVRRMGTYLTTREASCLSHSAT